MYDNSGSVIVKLFAYGARSLGFDFRSRNFLATISESGYLLLPCYDFRDWYILLPSRNMAEIKLKRREFAKQPTNQSVSGLSLRNLPSLIQSISFQMSSVSGKVKSTNRVKAVNARMGVTHVIV